MANSRLQICTGDFNAGSDSSALLASLACTESTDEDRRLAILYLETLPISELEVVVYLRLAGEYINRNRFSLDSETSTATMAAIRKYAMNVPEEHFGKLASWFEPSESEALSNDIELELAKSVASRFSFEHVKSGLYQPLFDALLRLANRYSTHQLFLQENFASIATNAVVGCGLIAARAGKREMVSSLFGRVQQLNVDWFTELVARRLHSASQYIRSRDVEYARLVNGLAASLT